MSDLIREAREQERRYAESLQALAAEHDIDPFELAVAALEDMHRGVHRLPADFPSDEDVEVAARVIYGSGLPTSSFDKMGRTIPFDESGSTTSFRQAARAALQAIADTRRTEEEG